MLRSHFSKTQFEALLDLFLRCVMFVIAIDHYQNSQVACPSRIKGFYVAASTVTGKISSMN